MCAALRQARPAIVVFTSSEIGGGSVRCGFSPFMGNHWEFYQACSSPVAGSSRERESSTWKRGEQLYRLISVGASPEPSPSRKQLCRRQSALASSFEKTRLTCKPAHGMGLAFAVRTISTVFWERAHTQPRSAQGLWARWHASRREVGQSRGPIQHGLDNMVLWIQHGREPSRFRRFATRVLARDISFRCTCCARCFPWGTRHPRDRLQFSFELKITPNPMFLRN